MHCTGGMLLLGKFHDYNLDFFSRLSITAKDRVSNKNTFAQERSYVKALICKQKRSIELRQCISILA